MKLLLEQRDVARGSACRSSNFTGMKLERPVLLFEVKDASDTGEEVLSLSTDLSEVQCAGGAW